VIRLRRYAAAAGRRLAAEGGYSLTELMVVLAIILIVVGALTQLFVSASNAEMDMNKRFQAQQDGRLALDKLRREIHCANTVTGAPPTSSIVIKLGSYCPTNGTGAAVDVTWCTKDKNGTTPPAVNAAPYTLWRVPGSSCSGTGGRRWAGNLTTGTVFPTYTAPTGGNLGTLSVDLPVDLTPADTRRRYTLKDDIVLRNTAR
jgi:prepilin-type N-terminal cleavage/methylation domain-containing protein